MILLLKNLLFTLIVPGTVAVYGPLAIAGESGLSSRWWIALPFFVVGLTIYGWGVWDFATFGRGTPAPMDAPKQLVVRGLYRFSRNPMYVGVVSAILGWAVAFASLGIAAYGLAVVAAFHLFVTTYEEPHLRDAFGDGYRDYCSRVGRWLPRIGGSARG